jgi:hypothetical protein
MAQVSGGIKAGPKYQKRALTIFTTFGVLSRSIQKGKTATYTKNGTGCSFTNTSVFVTYCTAIVGFCSPAKDDFNIIEGLLIFIV